MGHEALRIADNSNPRYRLFWPIRYGAFNERDYKSKRRVLEDIATIIEHAMKVEMRLEKKDLKTYSAVLVVPDLYEKNYVTEMVDLLLKEFWFSQVCIIQVFSIAGIRVEPGLTWAGIVGGVFRRGILAGLYCRYWRAEDLNLLRRGRNVCAGVAVKPEIRWARRDRSTPTNDAIQQLPLPGDQPLAPLRLPAG